MKQSFISCILAVLFAVALVPQVNSMPMGDDVGTSEAEFDCMDCEDCDENQVLPDCEKTCQAVCGLALNLTVLTQRLQLPSSFGPEQYGPMTPKIATAALPAFDLPPPRA